MKFRDALKYGFYEFQHLKEDYRLRTKGDYRKDLVLKYIQFQLTLLYPIAPHFSEMVWIDHFKKVKGTEKYADIISNHTWPVIRRENIDFTTLDSYTYLEKFKKNLRNTYKRLNKRRKKKKGFTPFTKCTVYITHSYQPW